MSETCKTALVTGASSGIGRATAMALAREGFTVAASARRAPMLEEVVATIRGAEGIAAAFAADLESPGAPATLVRNVAERFGRIDLLVNNAGWGYCAPLGRTPEAAARRIFDLNLMVPLLLMREALPHLRVTRGLIVNVSSMSGLVASPYYAAYSASKAGLNALSNAVRIEERDAGVRVVSICPGPVATEFGVTAGGAPVHADRVGVRVQSPEEIAAIIVSQTRSPRRTVATTGLMRLGAAAHALVPSLYDAVALRWARRLAPEIEKGLREV